MAQKFLRAEVQKALAAAAVSGPFYAVRYVAATQDPTVDTTAALAPSGVTVNELAASWSTAQNKRGDKRDRVTWRYQLVLAFDAEVVSERFERAITDVPVRVLRDLVNGLTQQATARLASADYRHPPRQAPNGGSQIFYEFDVEVTPL